MVRGCICVCDIGDLHIWKGTINAEEYMEVSEQHILPSRQRHILHLEQQRGFAGEESGCWTVLPAVQNFHQQETFGAS